MIPNPDLSAIRGTDGGRSGSERRHPDTTTPVTSSAAPGHGTGGGEALAADSADLGGAELRHSRDRNLVTTRRLGSSVHTHFEEGTIPNERQREQRAGVGEGRKDVYRLARMEASPSPCSSGTSAGCHGALPTTLARDNRHAAALGDRRRRSPF